jgi:hypothetical protein
VKSSNESNEPTKSIRFPLARWLLAPRTTWRARRLAAEYGPGMDARTAWELARLARHPEELGYALRDKQE